MTGELGRIRELEQKSIAAFDKHKGKLLRCEYLCGYNGYDSDDVACDVIVRVANTALCDLVHWNSEWLDPYWNVDLVYTISGTPPAGSYWIDGPSFNRLTGEVQWNGVHTISRWEYWKLHLKGRVNQRWPSIPERRGQ